MSEALCWAPSVVATSDYASFNFYDFPTTGTPSIEGWGKLFSLDAARSEREFSELSKEWLSATLNMSSSRDMFTHPAYLRVIELGWRAVPSILKELQSDDPPHWFVALSTITKKNPVPAEDAGKIAKMAAAWLRWGAENGYSKWQNPQTLISR